MGADAPLRAHRRARRPDRLVHGWSPARTRALCFPGAGYLAVGLLMSALTSSQIVALVLTSLVVLGLFMLGVFGEYIAREGTRLHDVAVYVSVWAQMNDFAAGIVDTRHLVFSGSMIAVPLFLAVRRLEAERWA
ncbi:MAG: hypothetical protein U0235_06015 [Polyangiaceae bacterium]